MENVPDTELFTKMKATYSNNGWRIAALFAAFVFSGMTLFVTILHYQNKLTLNSTLWIFWLLSMIAFMLANLSSLSRIKNYWCCSNNKATYLIFIFISVFYFLIRVAAYKTSPLNNYGIFDDAAWDIYLAKQYILSDQEFFQPFFLDTNINISKEALFHYFTIACFKLFGYNLFVFNMGLFFLGFISVLFTTLSIHTLFNRPWITVLGAIIMLTFPLHVTQTFMGHRYAIAMPLIMISYYYLASGFKNNSSIQLCLGGIFVGLSICGAPMGRQYLMALLLTIPLSIIFCSQKTVLVKRYFQPLCISLTALLISLIPFFCYIHFNSNVFFRERWLLTESIHDIETHGLSTVIPKLNLLALTFFSPSAGYRQFMPFYPLLPLAYWTLLIPGMMIALSKKRWEVCVMCVLPAFIAFLTEWPYDYRIQISTPFWIISMLYAVNSIANEAQLKRAKTTLLAAIAILSISVGLVSSVHEVRKVYSSTDYIILGRLNIAFLRFTQDIVRGNEQNPSIDMNTDELYPITNTNNTDYKVFACPERAFGEAHLYLQNLHEDEILSFCHGPLWSIASSDMLKDPKIILFSNLEALDKYKDSNKGLILIWEASEKTKSVVDLFKPFQLYGYFKTYRYSINDSPDKQKEVWVLKINKENVVKFLNEVKSLKL